MPWPPWRDAHIWRLTDDTGMFQHAKYGVPDPSSGYTTDDNARALILAVLLYEHTGRRRYLNLAWRYLSFVLYAQKDRGKFRNFMAYNREFLEQEGSEDCFGRCLWALGYTLASSRTPVSMKHACREMIKKALPAVQELQFARGWAYSLIGLGYLESAGTRELINILAGSLLSQYRKQRSPDWQWFEDTLTYSNAVLPRALFSAYQILPEPEILATALESLSFLEKICFEPGFFKPVGCQGWYTRGGRPAPYDEQPLEAGEMILAYLAAYRVSGRKEFLVKASRCLEWYHGNNSCGLSLIDPETCGCYDGITGSGLNLNQGAESIVSYGIARLALLRAYREKHAPIVCP
ncbi:MAG: glycosyltransferase [Desulfurispora sp.]|uniref:glycosyltransferase n=1 Tax=Desulfurispora sp. TaxID=3014275 RepID=UPI00404A6A45